MRTQPRTPLNPSDNCRFVCATLMRIAVLFALVYVIMNRYTITPSTDGSPSYRLNRLTGGIVFIYGIELEKCRYPQKQQ